MRGMDIVFIPLFLFIKDVKSEDYCKEYTSSRSFIYIKHCLCWQQRNDNAEKSFEYAKSDI